MGGKSSQSTSQVSIPPEVLANYQAANSAATSAASLPFQSYNGQFVAPINSQQNTGIAATNAAANQAQPYFGAATSAINNAQSSAQPYNNAATQAVTQAGQPVTGQQINQYMSPYIGDVLGSTESLLNQQNQQAMAGQTGNAIMSGAFGGDRTGIAAANLQQQQDLAAGNVYSGILNQGYNTALSAAQNQQQVGLAQGQALAGIGNQVYSQGANTSSALAGLGTGAQNASLQGATAQLSAGQLQQQTQQAQDTAEYNQFLQQQSYPFQTAQFLANVAEGTGSLSGSTTTSTQPGGFFSDDRLKEDIEPVGETYDGQKIIRFRYKGQKDKQLGLSAQKVERIHPDAVGLAGGYRTVDYGKATDDAAERGHFCGGGLAAANDSIMYRGKHASGGSPSGLSLGDVAALIQAQQQMYAPQQGGMYGGIASGAPRGGSSYVPSANLPVSHLAVAEAPQRQTSAAQNVQQIGNLGEQGAKLYEAWNSRNGASMQKALDKPALSDSADEQPMPDPGVAPDSDAAAPDFARDGLADGGSPYEALLEAQQQMYNPMQQQRRDMPQQNSGGHQLAISNAPPPAAQNGAGNVMQVAGLGDKGYKLYSHFNPATPATTSTPAGGVAPAPIATPGAAAAPTEVAANSPGLAAGASPTIAAAPAAEVAAPAAAEAAAPAAAEAGAGAAAGSAASAAAGAGAGAALDAGATDAAVALAAEYAASAAAMAAAAAKRGGRIRGKFGTGGMPYEGNGAGTPYQEADGTMDIPDTQNTNQLQKPATAQKQPTGLQTIMTLGDPNKASDIWGGVFSNQALARGGLAGRRGYATDGSVDDSAPDQSFFQPDAPAFDPKYAIGRTLNSYLDSLKSGFSGHSNAALPSGETEVSAPAISKSAPAGGVAPADSTSIVPKKRPTLTLSPSVGRSVPIDMQPAPGLSPAPPDTAPAPTAPVQDAQPDLSKPDLSSIAGAPSVADSMPPPQDKKSGIWDKVSHVLSGIGDSELTKTKNLIPLLTGIAAMGTAPTRSLGVALASGLGAGAQAYLPTQAAQSKIAQTQAQTGLTGADEWAKIQEVAGNQNMLALPGPAPTGGKSFTTSDGKTYHMEPKGSLFPTGNAPASTSYQFLGNQGKSEAESDVARLTRAPPTAGEAEASKTAEAGISDNATNAYSQKGTLNQLTSELAKIPKNGVVSSGPLSPWRNAMINRANDLVRTIAPSIGVDPSQYLISPDEAGDVTAANKLGGFFRLAATKNADQRSLGALEETANMIPSPQISRDQAAKVAAGMYVDAQKPLDEFNYINEYKKYLDQTHPGMSQNYLVQNAREAFRKDHPDTEYGAMKDGMNKLLTTTYRDGRSVFPDFYNGKLPPEYADKLTGVPGISRMFLNR